MNQTKSIIEAVMNESPTTAQELVSELLKDKAVNRLFEHKEEFSRSLFAEEDELDLEDDEDDLEDDDDDDFDDLDLDDLDLDDLDLDDED
jgi:DNA-directed RNA polymerase subunit delta